MAAYQVVSRFSINHPARFCHERLCNQIDASGPADDRQAKVGAYRGRRHEIAIAIVFVWIGFLKFQPYEADSITPFVANSPFVSFFYEHPKEYKPHLTKEGELQPAQREWQTANNTYRFSNGLGALELLIGALTLAGLVSLRLGLIGATLAFATPFVTLSFLLTTPEAWVPALGDAQHGFPFLSGAGRLVIKDVLILAGAWIILVDTSRAWLQNASNGAELVRLSDTV